MATSVLPTYPGWETTLTIVFLLILFVITYGLYRLLMGHKPVVVVKKR